uniref:Late nodulin-like protein n=1 Tax=Astragalus sinicus TaxID=47065 RepID=Q07A38_ASTSI|nr:late nodulin-like protein [Astragalus sinicus]
MVVIMKLVYVFVVFASLFLMTINVNAMPCETDDDCKKKYIPAPGWEAKCIDRLCMSQKI